MDLRKIENWSEELVDGHQTVPNQPAMFSLLNVHYYKCIIICKPYMIKRSLFFYYKLRLSWVAPFFFTMMICKKRRPNKAGQSVERVYVDIPSSCALWAGFGGSHTSFWADVLSHWQGGLTSCWICRVKKLLNAPIIFWSHFHQSCLWIPGTRYFQCWHLSVFFGFLARVP